MTTITEQAKKRNRKALELLPAFKEELGEEADGVSDDNLLKFLRWKPSVERATERFRAHLQWRQEFPNLLSDLYASQDDQLKRLLASDVLIIPETMQAKNGSPVVVGRLRNNDMSDGRTPEQVCRMFFYLIDRMLEREEAQLYGITVFHDMRGLSPKNLHPGVPKLLLRGMIGNFPTRVKGIYILNAPWFFRGLFAVMSSIFFPPKLKRRVHFIEDVSDVYEVIDKDLLLKEHGGNLDFDSKEWVAKQCDREQNDESFETLQSCWNKSK